MPMGVGLAEVLVEGVRRAERVPDAYRSGALSPRSLKSLEGRVSQEKSPFSLLTCR